MLSDTDVACGVINLTICLGMYESSLHQRKARRKTTTHTHQHLTRAIVQRKPN